MIKEMETAIKRLESLPPEAAKSYAERINRDLTELEDLRAEIQTGLDSGFEVFDVKDFKREARERLKAKQNVNR